MQRGGTVTPKVAASKYQTVVLKSDGTVWATGYNDASQLGVGNAVLSMVGKTSTFTQCVDADGPIKDATDVACGQNNTAIIRSNGEVWQCGGNGDGQLGNTSVSRDSTVFVKSYKSKTGDFIDKDSIVTDGDSANVEAITGATQIACGGYHTAVIINGEVWQCGDNDDGQLGNNSKTDSSVFVQSYKLKDGNSVESPDSSNTEPITGVTQIACINGRTAVIVNGEVWQCGNNYCGSLGNTSIKSDSINDHSKVFVKSYKSKDGNYVASPSGDNTEAVTGATKIWPGYQHTAIIINGEIWQCGNNNKGQLGNTSVSGYSKVFVKSYKSKDGNRVESPDSSNTEPITEATQIACGDCHTAVLLDNGTVWQSGDNGNGQLGDNSTTNSPVFVQSSNMTGATQIACGWSNTVSICGKNTTTSLYGVGQNDKGQLGLGDAAGTDNVLTFTKSTTIGYIILPDIDSLLALGEGSRDVTGAGQFVNTYRLDVEWSAPQYTYNAEWNVDESKWVGTWEAVDGGDQIVVKNGSATPCKVEFNFNANDEFKSPSDGEPGTKGTFADPNVADEPALDTTTNTVPLAVYTAATPATSQKTVKLGIEGIPNSKAGTDIETPTTVGSVTVTLKNS